MASKRRSASRTSRTTMLAIIGSILAVALIVAGLWWDNQRTAVASNSLGSAGPLTSAPVSPPESATFAPLADALPKLTDQSQPFRLLVIGDSTGNDADEWVAITARQLSTAYGRDVKLRTWDPATMGFDREMAAPGTGEELTIFNFSAPGEGPKYAYRNLEALADKNPDLVIINHGHNSAAIQSELEALLGELTDLWTEVPALVVVDQNPRTDNVQQSDAAAAGIAAFSSAHPDVTVVDVRSAFADGDLVALLRDGLHPNAAGSQLWAETMWSALAI